MIVKCYWNIHKKCWSVMDAKTRRVIKHLEELSLFDCTFRVSEAGRQRVLRDRKKNVHAFVVGRLSEGKTQPGGRKVRYNPYETPKFMCEGKYVIGAFCTQLHNDKTVTCLEPIYE
jgi:hypothetical protein